MKKRYLAIGMATALSAMISSGPLGSVQPAAADSQEQSLEEEIRQLKDMVNKLNNRLEDAELKLKSRSTATGGGAGNFDAKFEDIEGALDELDERVAVNERHSATDKLALSVDLRTEYTMMKYEDAAVLPEWAQSMLTLWAFDELAKPMPQNLTAPTSAGDIAAIAGINLGFGTNIASGPYNTVGDVADLDGDGQGDYTFNPEFAGPDSPYYKNLMQQFPTLFNGGFINGIYLPTGMDLTGMGGPAFPSGTYISPADAMAMMGAFMMSVDEFVGVLGAAAPDAQGVIANAGPGGAPYFGPAMTGDNVTAIQGMFKSIDPARQNIENDGLWTTRARIDMRSDPTPNLTFGGRLSANKVWGDSTGVKWFTGDFSSVTMDGNVSQKGSDSAIRLERGFVTYRDDLGDTHWHFSLGRRPAADGAPWEIGTHGVLGGSPLAHAINWQFDGASLGFDLSKPSGIPGFNFKVCYGQGFESGAGSGNSYSMSSDNNVNDVNFLGYIWRWYDNGTTKVVNMYAHAFDITDGFTGLVAMPFAITGVDADGDDKYDAYFLDANRGGYISRMEAFTNIGDMDLLSILVQSKFRDIDWFVDFAWDKTEPTRNSLNPMMQFMGMTGLLNSDYELESHNGWSVWAGVKTPMPWKEGAALGFEFNYGSKYWLGFNGAEDTVNGSKLATRGSVYEIYYHHPFIGNKFLMSVGGQYFDYEYTGSGNPMGEPKKVAEVTAFDTLMPVPDKLWSYYINLNYRW